MQPKMTTIALCLLAACFYSSSAATTITLLEDDFEDGVINGAVWSSPSGSVSENAGVASMFDRGYWLSVGLFDIDLGPIEINCDVSVLNDWDFLTVAIRSDGTPYGVFREVYNGVTVNLFRQLYAPDGFSCFVRNHVNGSIGSALINSSPHMAGTTDEWWHLRVLFDTDDVRVWMNGEFVGIVPYLTQHAYRHIAFYNREGIGPIRIDNVLVTQDVIVTGTSESSWARIKNLWH